MAPSAVPVLRPGEWLGVMGGGQLGRMFCMAAQQMGYRVCVLDPAADSPAGRIAERHLRADYLDADALAQMASSCAAVTTEFENVPAGALEWLAMRCRVAPGAASVSVAQDRIAEKRFIASCGVDVAPWQPVRTPAEAAAVDRALLPGILKSARLGYDGKGQARVASPSEVEAAFQAFGGVECVLEQRLSLAAEVSVVLARALDGTSAVYPVAQNVHLDGILALTVVPAQVGPAVLDAAREAALRIAVGLDYAGVLCLECFVLADGRVLANEIAPRPHNSGHFSLDASVTSQFEQQVRVIAGLPLGATDSLCPAAMLNILGDAWYPGAASDPADRREPDWARVLSNPRARLHLYGKDDARRARKMGHLTVLGATIDAVLADVASLAPLVAQPVIEIPRRGAARA
ncbi:MAG: 5-(carboxyamino)imidazole ribonucleotide synthase [Lautropia sp.]